MHWVSVFRLMFELIKYMDLIIYIYIYIFIYTLEHKYTKSSNPKQKYLDKYFEKMAVWLDSLKIKDK